MRKQSLLILSLAALLLLGACAKPAVQGYDPAATTQALLDSAAFSEPLEALDLDIVCILYGFDEADLVDGAVYSSTGATAEEVAVLRLKSADAAKTAIPLLQARVADLKDACADYLPAELPKLDTAIIEQRGDTALLIIPADAIAAQRALGELIK